MIERSASTIGSVSRWMGCAGPPHGRGRPHLAPPIESSAGQARLMARDPRPHNDWTRQFDSVFKPRQNLPGSRRGRFLIVFALFLVAEAAYLIVRGSEGQPITVAAVLWAAWLIAWSGCSCRSSVPRRSGQPAAGPAGRCLGVRCWAVGLPGRRVGVAQLPVWWPVAAISAAVASASIVLGVLEWRRGRSAAVARPLSQPTNGLA